MADWSDRPPTDDRPHYFELVRTPRTYELRGVVTSRRLYGIDTHFWQKRTIKCTAPDCEPCRQGMPRRWHGYISCVVGRHSEHVLFEFTAAAGSAFASHCDEHGTLRGCQFLADRPSNRENGRVRIRIYKEILPSGGLPEAPNIIRMLHHIWNLPWQGDGQQPALKSLGERAADAKEQAAIVEQELQRIRSGDEPTVESVQQILNNKRQEQLSYGD